MIHDFDLTLGTFGLLALGVLCTFAFAVGVGALIRYSTPDITEEEWLVLDERPVAEKVAAARDLLADRPLDPELERFLRLAGINPTAWQLRVLDRVMRPTLEHRPDHGFVLVSSTPMSPDAVQRVKDAWSMRRDAGAVSVLPPDATMEYLEWSDLGERQSHGGDFLRAHLDSWSMPAETPAEVLFREEYPPHPATTAELEFSRALREYNDAAWLGTRIQDEITVGKAYVRQIANDTRLALGLEIEHDAGCRREYLGSLVVDTCDCGPWLSAATTGPYA